MTINIIYKNVLPEICLILNLISYAKQPEIYDKSNLWK